VSKILTSFQFTTKADRKEKDSLSEPDSRKYFHWTSAYVPVPTGK
jgi:hypothetical protein